MRVLTINNPLRLLDLTDHRLPVATGDVVELDPVVVEVVEHAHAELVTLPVVRLAATSTTNNYS